MRRKLLISYLLLGVQKADRTEVPALQVHLRVQAQLLRRHHGGAGQQEQRHPQEHPPAQTWAERIFRTRSNPVYKVEAFNRYLEDVKMVTKSEISGSFYNYYSKDQFNKRFSKLLY
ncbi:hypothetical protein NQ315_001404 [Exocentrus adspersus]|uniref:Uncharacterized protein n=1 Tax=Exocentrus adspersus TaxID=1586481 RepID=A0AAV8WFS5_9CUCU|nr:hypothetical protein NQ315_001404 [Exocentrus adspersus]